ncbi:MAG: L-histidine N(alpha)-methyltransferase [Betaproteobacteria bacterium]|nr:L-histidine N(alpha)-methyltransferase [Betaproteobacteria bacterium]
MNTRFPRTRKLQVLDDAMSAEVCAGLARYPKRLPSRFLYDAHGSALFEAICTQPEYYLTRTELAIMQRDAAAMAAAIGPEAMLIEYGSGSGVKTRLLLAALESPQAYVPIEISQAALAASSAALVAAFPHLELLPICADFTELTAVPRAHCVARRRIVYFPGSTLGNFVHDEALDLLRGIRRVVGARGGALIGIDLHKNPRLIEAAYNDAAGVTAAFTLNMLSRFNRELDADFDLDAFRHRARYNGLARRVETDLVSRHAQRVHIGNEVFSFAQDEPIRVEISSKYTLDDFAHMAQAAGMVLRQYWTDAQQMFAVCYLEVCA